MPEQTGLAKLTTLHPTVPEKVWYQIEANEYVTSKSMKSVSTRFWGECFNFETHPIRDRCFLATLQGGHLQLVPLRSWAAARAAVSPEAESKQRLRALEIHLTLNSLKHYLNHLTLWGGFEVVEVVGCCPLSLAHPRQPNPSIPSF